MYTCIYTTIDKLAVVLSKTHLSSLISELQSQAPGGPGAAICHSRTPWHENKCLSQTPVFQHVVSMSSCFVSCVAFKLQP